MEKLCSRIAACKTPEDIERVHALICKKVPAMARQEYVSQLNDRELVIMTERKQDFSFPG